MWLEARQGVGELGVAWQGRFGIGAGWGWGWNSRVGGVGGTLCTTSGSSVCGQGGCQALGLWIAGDCWGDCGQKQRKMSENRKDGTS